MAAEPRVRRKLILLDSRVAAALDMLARDRGVTVNELAGDALREYLKKHGRPLTLADAFTKSARTVAANDAAPRHARRKGPKDLA